MKVKKAVEILFMLGLFFFPFNEYEGIKELGEFSSEAAIIFFIPALFLIIAYTIITKKIYFPIRNELYLIVLLFLVWCLFSFIFNFYDIDSYFFKQTKGVNRFIRQFFSLILSVILFFQIYWFVLKEKTLTEIFYIIRKIFTYSLVIATIYGFVEILISFFGFSILTPIIDLLSYLPFLEPKLHVEGRISSFTYEPPFLAIYLITIAGWMFSYIITDNGYKKYIPSIIILVLTFFSGSRTALVVIAIQFLVFLFIIAFYFNKKRQVFTFLKYSIVFLFLAVSVSGPKLLDVFKDKIESLDFIGNLKSSPSNKSRLGIQYTSLLIFSENPILGVGFGQQAYEARGRYPYWSTLNNYEFKIFYKNNKEKSFPPGYNMYTRILAELGIIGFLIFGFLQFRMLKEAKRLIKFTNENNKILGLAIYVSLVGLFINWLQIDSFRIYGVWISLAILIISSKIKNEQNISTNTTL